MVPLLLAAAAVTGYVDPSACRPCHQQIFDSYMKTGMGRSFARVTQVPPLGHFEHAGSRREYAVIQRGGAFLLRRTPPELIRSIDYVIGSGNHSKTFLHRDVSGRLLQLPVSWYSANGGYWAMSPGYDRPDHSDFRREVPDSCLFCHNGYPSEANGGLASGIDCQRCHGPGEAHVKRTGPIVKSTALDVCLQCHLESASRTLPEAVRRPGRSVFSYRPGEPLGDYKVFFEFANAREEAADRITVNGAGYGLLKSPCYLRSGGRLQCTTCHDPHNRGVRAQACQGCHAAVHDASRRDCAGCHMPKRRTEDAVHVIMTDHRIRKRPPANPLAMIAERHDKTPPGPVSPLYPLALSNSAADRLILAMAGNSATALEAVISETRPAHPEPYLRLAELRPNNSAAALRRAIQLDPANPAPYALLADESALSRFPNDVPLLNSVAIGYVGRGQFDEALALLQRAVSLAPDDSLSWLNLGVCREAKGDAAGALAAYSRALALQPDFERARTYFARVRKATGK